MEANQALVKCYQSVDKDIIESGHQGKMDMMCIKEKDAVKSILESNDMTMTRVVKERLDVLMALTKDGITFKTEER